MIALYDDQRRMLLRVGSMLAVGGCAILPFTIPPSSLVANAEQVRQLASVSAPAVPGRLEFPEIAVSRDPFVPDAVLLENAVPNPGYSAQANLPVVRAIVTGDEPRALIDAGDGVRMLGIGDKVGTETIIDIDSRGVQLSGGIRLGLPGLR